MAMIDILALDLVLNSGFLDDLSNHVAGQQGGILKKVSKPVMRILMKYNFEVCLLLRRHHGINIAFVPSYFRR